MSAAVIASTIAVAGGMLSVSGQEALPPGLEALGIEAEPIRGPEFIHGDQAKGILAGQMMPDPSSRVDAYLVRATDRTAALIRDRAVWMLVVSDLEISGGAPLLGDGTHADPTVYHTMYVYLDARTGEWLLSRLEA